MNKAQTLLLSIIVCNALYAKENESHTHTGDNNIKINYEVLDFSNSKKKEDGKRYGVELDHEGENKHIQFYYESTNTDTTNIIPKDLEVDKYILKYQYKMTSKNRITLLYSHIKDNIMKETDGGNIYGVGYNINNLYLTQYFSDYSNFDVYQTDLKYNIKYKFDIFKLKTTFIGKYIHLKDKDSNNFSKKAKEDYLTTGIKFHTHYNGYHLGAGAFFGDRIFAVMKDGLQVQHHAMEFKESYMIGVGHSLGKNISTHLRYSYHKAKEVPINNDNVKVKNISLDFVYKF
jgi:hypothetical protein